MSATVVALYKFVTLDDYRELREPLLNACLEHDVRGLLLLAREGINGTIAGSRGAVNAVLDYLRGDPRLADLDWKESFDDTPPFHRMKVKLKREIVTMGVENIDPRRTVGTYVDPEQWNALISDPEVLLIDTRNDYEVAIGSFQGAVDPNTRHFREFPDFVHQHCDPRRHRKVAMFCTGGIRCEKASAYMKEQGFEEVYHLKGGILKYLEEIPQEQSLWQGECFVFDKRVAVRHELVRGTHELCRGCRRPIGPADKRPPKYEHGVSCPHCHDSLTEDQKARFRERRKQVELARQRGEQHIGAPPPVRQRRVS